MSKQHLFYVKTFPWLDPLRDVRRFAKVEMPLGAFGSISVLGAERMAVIHNTVGGAKTKAWWSSESYAPAKEIRNASAHCEMLLVEGVRTASGRRAERDVAVRRSMGTGGR